LEECLFHKKICFIQVQENKPSQSSS